MKNNIDELHQKLIKKSLNEGPIVPYIKNLVTVLVNKGYKKNNISKRFAVISEFNRWLIKKKINSVI